jgi:hypothetical protein
MAPPNPHRVVTIVRNPTRSGPLGWKSKAARGALEAAVERLEEGADALLVRLPAGIVAEEPVEEIEAQGSVEDAGAERKAEANVRALLLINWMAVPDLGSSLSIRWFCGFTVPLGKFNQGYV